MAPLVSPTTAILLAITLSFAVCALVGGMRAGMVGSAHDVTWLILVFYVPALWTTLALIVWQLVARRGEGLAGERADDPACGWRRYVSTGFPAFVHPSIPAGMMNTFAYPSLTADPAASWHAGQRSLAQ